MFSMQEFMDGMRLLAVFTRQSAEQAQRTLHWVRESCEADGHPEWLVQMVVSNFIDLLATMPAGEMLP